MSDYAKTLFLPQTDFPMRAGLPQREPDLLDRWSRIGLFSSTRSAAHGRPKFVLHDGPPYANGNIHLGTALNKILKDIVVRSHAALGYDANYVPGWDCHGLPIEWKVEEQYRAKGLNKDEIPVIEFRQECRAFAERWVDVQRDEFKRLGINGDWDHPYLTMAHRAEATIAHELMSFAVTGQLYRGSKPVMWSVVERTALAEAEVEYEDHVSDTIHVAFPIRTGADDSLTGARVVIWTTTPWTIPGNRAVAFSSGIAYGLYRVVEAADDNWARVGDSYIIADTLAPGMFKAARVTAFERVADVGAQALSTMTLAHPLAALGYGFDVPMLDGKHVTDETGTGFVHTAPGHGREDFDLWMASGRVLRARGIDTAIPYTVAADGSLTASAPGFEGQRVYDDAGAKGGANDAVMAALVEAGALIARGRLRHQYPHSWRSKKPVIFRNTPQWFIALDQPVDSLGGKTLREVALREITETCWLPPQGENRITSMVSTRPDWVVSRQRAWGVPITVFVHKGTGEILRDEAVNSRIFDAFVAQGADAWFAEGAARLFLSPGYDPNDYEMVTDVLDVWFDSGSTHAFVLGDGVAFPGLSGINRVRDGGPDRVMYLEGSDQHRGWFQSSLLESSGTRGRAPYDIVLTHGFVLADKGVKMAKSLGNVIPPEKVIAQYGADILRFWVAASDCTDDLKIGPEILKTFSETYRKLRNSIRWMLGNLAHRVPEDDVPYAQMPELERLILHRLAEVDADIRVSYAAFDPKTVVALLNQFLTSVMSSYYFDIRKDALYCEPISSTTRRAALTVIELVFRRVAIWLAPILPFTAEDIWLHRYPSEDGSVHLEPFPDTPKEWLDFDLVTRWNAVRKARRVVLGALEIERAAKRIGTGLEANVVVHLEDPVLLQAVRDVGEQVFADVCITSGATLVDATAPAEAFRLDDAPGIAVMVTAAEGTRCARSWRVSPLVGSDPEYPDVTPRDAQALREWHAVNG